MLLFQRAIAGAQKDGISVGAGAGQNAMDGKMGEFSRIILQNEISTYYQSKGVWNSKL